MGITRVVNYKKEPYDIIISRPSIYGNPWTHKDYTLAPFKVATRKEAIENYSKWLKGEDFKDILQEQRKKILDNLPNLKDKVLACYCKPLACHGDVLVELVEQL